jgi:SAM-dependent methyltransferase
MKRSPVAMDIPVNKGANDLTKRTCRIYSHLWSSDTSEEPPERYHYHRVQEVILDQIVRGQRGIDVGCGKGYDVCAMAKINPKVRFFGVDISDGIFAARRITKNLENVFLVAASAEALPFKDEIFDFGYSYGVIHHLPNPDVGFSELTRVIQRGGGVFLYLYEDHRDNFIKFMALKGINFVRKYTTRLSPNLLNSLCFILSPLVVIFLTWPSKILGKFNSTKRFRNKIPYNFGKGLFSVRADLFDRLGAPLEHRFNENQIRKLFGADRYAQVSLAKMNDVAGWVAWGYKSWP